MSPSLGTTPRTIRIRRIRLLQSVCAVAVLAAASWLASLNPLGEWWFWVAATTAVTVALVEPYFTGVTGALLFSLGAFGAGLTADRQGMEILWNFYFALAGIVLLSATSALAVGQGQFRDGPRWIATRFGRPIWLGLSAVAIGLLGLVAEESLETAVYLASGTFLAFMIASPDWYKMFNSKKLAAEGEATIETAIEPNLILLAMDRCFTRGTEVRVEGSGTSRGVVLGNLAHKDGNRVQIALENPWYDVAQSSGEHCKVTAVGESESVPVAFVAEGSTDRVLSLRPFGTLTRGDTVCWEEPATHRRYLYQVLDRELARETWDSSSVVTEHATAAMLGAVETGGLSYDSVLPPPYVPVFSAEKVRGELTKEFVRIGVIAGTQVPFGVSTNRLRQHHLAILGMSGMGKSTVARKIVKLLSDDSVVVVLDGTGEYRSRFKLPAWSQSIGLDTTGSWVYEPGGVQAKVASDFINGVMTVAAEEYKLGAPKSRTVLLEEAHSYLPEWNFAADRNEGVFVAQSCRYILQARKFEINFVLVSQRTATISKSALSQCESYVLLRTLDDTSLQYVEGVLGRGFRDTVAGLSRYQAVCVGPAFSTAAPVIVDLDPYENSSEFGVSSQ